MAYATGADLVVRYDVHLIGDLLLDDGNSVAAVDVPTHATVTAMLDDAEAAIDAALRQSGRYTAAELASIVSSSANLLKRMNCDIAMAYLFRRRGDQDADKLKAYIDLAEEHLKRLREGTLVLITPDESEIDAGIIKPLPMTQDQANQSPLTRDNVRNYFPARRTRD